MVEKRSKPGRPTKRIQKQLDAIDAQMRKSSDNTPSDEENDLEEQTESETTASMLPKL